MSTPSALAPIAVLEHAAVGAPITRVGVSLFPVYVFQPLQSKVVTAQPGSVEIAEAESATVPILSVTSVIDDPFLLVEGEILAGGLQHRTLNVSVLVSPHQRLDIPVSCVEAGRWSGSKDFTGTSGYVSRRVRRAKSATVSETVRRTGGKESGQGAIWQTIDHELDRMAISSTTRSYTDLESVFDAPRGSSGHHSRLAEAAGELIGSGPLPGQCGLVVAHGSRVVSAEVLATPELLSAQWSAMVRASLLDAPSEVRGRPSASKALRFLRRLAKAPATEAAGVGLGTERHLHTSRMVGQILTWDEALIHASGFALAA